LFSVEVVFMYSDKLLDHLARPRNYGEMTDPDGVGVAFSAACGEELRLYIKVEGDTIADISFVSQGCGATLASTSIATEMMKGKPLDEALGVSTKQIESACGGLPEEKAYCAILAQEALRAAVHDYRRRAP